MADRKDDDLPPDATWNILRHQDGKFVPKGKKAKAERDATPPKPKPEPVAATSVPEDLDEADLQEAAEEEKLGFFARLKRVFTIVTPDDRRILKRLLPYMKPHRVRTIAAVLLSMVAGALVVPQLALMNRGLEVIVPSRNYKSLASRAEGDGDAPISAKALMTTAQNKDEPPPLRYAAPPVTARPRKADEQRHDLRETVLLFVAVVLVGAVLKFSESIIMTNVTRTVVKDLRDDCFKHVIRLPLRFHQSTHSGKLVARLTNDVNKMRELMTSVTIDMPQESFIFFGAFGYTIYRAGWAALFVVAFVIVAILPIRLIADKLRHRDKTAEAGSGDMYAVLSEALQGQKVVKAFTAERYEIHKFRRATKAMYERQLQTFRLRALTDPMVDVVGGIGIAAAIWILGLSVIGGKLNVPVVATVVVAMQRMNSSVRKIGKMQNDLVRGMVAAGRVNKILDVAPEVKETPGAIPFEDVRECIEFDDVKFHYHQDSPVLSGITFKMTRGETVAIVGPSGAGKTSLVDLVPRFYDVTGGAIRIDGRDVKDFQLKSLRQKIGIVSQETMLFRGTIKENIAYGMKKIDDDTVAWAAAAANATEFIAEKPKGYETTLGERGSRLSGGQRQRIAIARALLRNPPILILDEATSALDSEAEAAVQGALDRLMHGRTTLVIAHRLSTIRQAHRIIVLDKGTIVEQGTHDELVAANGKYARALALQMDALQRGEKEGPIDDFFREEAP